jgi:hypothetical protein
MDLHPSSSHERTAQLIPWLVNGTLRGDAVAAVRAHLAECAECRNDYDNQMRLQDLMQADGPLVFAAEPSFQKLMSRLEASEQARAEQFLAEDAEKGSQGEGEAASVSSLFERRPGARKWGSAVRWLAAAVVLQAMALSLGAWIWHGQDKANEARYATLTSRQASYATLTSPSALYGAGRRVRVVFWSSLSLDELKGVLHTVDAHIVDGPTDSNVYTLGFAQPIKSESELDTRIAALRANSAVLFAEPAQPSNPP